MAYRQLVMLNCKTSHETPLVRVKPDFTHISVTGVGPGDSVWFCYNKDNPKTILIEIEPGLTPFSELFGDYKNFYIKKIAGPESGPTTVEVLRGS
jgi:hypothetical protein